MERILLVDDEINVLTSLRRRLHSRLYDIFSAQDGESGLQVLQNQGPFAVIVSDLRMPGIDGIEFLSRARKIAPDTARIMLTGNADIEVAINAVNRDNLFRFLLKPISPENFLNAIDAGVEQYRLITRERELMDELAVLQRIDRELNATLDIQRAMKITLDWALQRSGAEAGVIGAAGDGQLQVMSLYGATLEAFTSPPPPASPDAPPDLPALSFEKWPALAQVVEIGNPEMISLLDHPGAHLAKESKQQILVPIRRENATIGVLLLETSASTPPPGNLLNFLVRLCDHASIAISNSQLYEAARTANQAKTEFISYASHELRNPLQAMIGYNQLMLSGALGQLTDAQREFLATMKLNTQRMIMLINDLSDVSRIESGHLRLEITTLPLKEAIKEVEGSQLYSYREKKQTLEIIMPDDLPPVRADRLRLVQVITNLVSNAHKYTPEGGTVHIGAECCANQWDPSGAPRVIHLWVQDNGIGMTPEDQQKVFQKFFRSGDNAARSVTGTGLGLHITRDLVEIQGGKIWFESQFRQGTTFHITIPVA